MRESERVRVGEFDEEERRDLCVRKPSVNEREGELGVERSGGDSSVVSVMETRVR